MADICKVCKAPLINGECHTLKATSKNFDVTVGDMPVRHCPKGHEGLYWFDKKFGTTFMDIVEGNGLMAKGKRTITLRLKYICPSCSEELRPERTLHTFKFEFNTKINPGRPYKVTLQAPALHCRRCDRHLLPYDKGEMDVYYLELHELIADALKSEFV